MASDHLETVGFWRELAPDLTIEPGSGPPAPVLRPDQATAETLLHVFDREGYLRIPGSQDTAEIARLAKLVTTLHEAGVHPVFAFVYREAWLPFWRLGELLEALLGGPHAVMPDIWAWHVDPRQNEAGWSPHRDRTINVLYPDRRPKTLSVWLPLTEATPLNSCMYVLPKHRDPDYADGAPDLLRGQLEDIRAVPAVPGDSLLWTSVLIHWGSHASELAQRPRLSMSVEFQRMDEPPFSRFFMQSGYDLTLEQKLAIIGLGVVKYQHKEKLSDELTARARRWMERIPDVFGFDR